MSALEKGSYTAKEDVTGTTHGETATPRATIGISNDGRGEQRPHLHAKTFLAIFAVCTIYFAQIYNVVGAGAQTNTIALTLGGSSSSVWLASPIAIGTAVLSPIVSQAADYWGRKWFLVLLTLCGAVGSIVVARANSMGMAIAGFTITGVSYGAQPLLHVVSSEVIPRRYRSWGQAADLVSNALGGITSLLVGGAFTRTSNTPSEGFRSYWYVSMCLFAFSSALVAFVYNPPRTERQSALSSSQKLGRLDWVGYGLLAAGVLLFCIGLSWSGNPFPWSDPHTSATFAVGLSLMLLLAVYEAFVKTDGMFQHELFRNRNFALVLVCVFCEGLAFFAANQYFAFQVGILYETDNLIVGVRYSIALLVSILSALFAGAYCAATRRTRWITVTAFLCFVVFFATMASSNASSSQNVWAFPVFLGAGLGLSLCALIATAQLSTPPELIATTTGLLIGIRSLGGSVGLAVYNALFTEAMSHLGDNIAAAVLPLGLPPSSLGPFISALTSHDDQVIFRIPGMSLQIAGAGGQAVLETFVMAFKHIWVAAGCFVAVGALVSVFIRDQPNEFNMHIDAPIEGNGELYSL